MDDMACTVCEQPAVPVLLIEPPTTYKFGVALVKVLTKRIDTTVDNGVLAIMIVDSESVDQGSFAHQGVFR
eukprot:m.73 g.73  ORF g.73 m.73 type:complete len:71 (-) comp113_c0_seq1:41-253(-)